MTQTEDAPGGGAAQRMFGAQAAQYATSQVHISDHRLDTVRRFTPAAGQPWALDLGTGAGFTAFSIADCADRVVASDLTREMLAETRRLGRERQLSNLLLLQNQAEALPIATESIDLIACRAAGHHFADLGAALDEVRRVLKPGGALVMADSVSPEDDNLYRWFNDVELRRDYSHIENRKVSVLEGMLADRGLIVAARELTATYMTFNAWVARTATPAAETAALRRDFLTAAPAIKDAFLIAETADGQDLSFAWPCLIFRAVKG